MVGSVLSCLVQVVVVGLVQDLAGASVGSFLPVVQQVHLQRLGKRQAQYPLS